MKKLSAFVVMTLLVSSYAVANNNIVTDQIDRQPSLFDQLIQEQPLEITIETDLSHLLESRRNDDYQAAELTYTKDKQAYRWKMKLRPRGKFRRTMCDFPPLKLELSKKDLTAAGLSKLDDLKLITHCLADSTTSTNLVFREYLAYKMYNVLDLNSLRVQLVKINYIDSNSAQEEFTRWGILLEDIDELAVRLQGEEVEQFAFLAGELDTIQHTYISVFQYMIGNTDWSILPIRNLKLIRQANRSGFVLIPYDFDFSSFVNAPYALPRGHLGQTSLHDRVYQGLITSPKLIVPILDQFQAKRKEVLALVTDFEQIDKAEKNDLLRSLRQFFRSIKDPNLFIENKPAVGP